MPAEERDLNLDVLRAGEIALPDLVTRLDTLPFFGRRRVVVVKDADAWKAPEQERLAAYLEHGPPPSALILVAQGLDRRRRLYAAIRRIGEVQEFPRMSVRQLPLWITERADIEAAVSRVSETTIFMLVDAIGARQAGQALRHLTDILRAEAPPYVLFMIARQFRMLYRSSVLLAARKPLAMLQEALGAPPFVVRRIAEQAKNFSPVSFPRIFARLLEADRAIKTAGHPQLALEMLIADLCVPAGEQTGTGERGIAGTR